MINLGKEMNKRIEELMFEVGISVEYLTNTKQIVLIEKFAELIVKECANIVNSLEQYEGPGDCATVEYIKEHFGVE